VRPLPAPAIDEVLALGNWSRTTTFGRAATCDWRVEWDAAAAAHIAIVPPAGAPARGTTPLLGEHNAWNTAAAVAAAADVGVAPATAVAALATFANVKRRLELRGEARGVRVYDDFAHHPTAIAATIAALRPQVGGGRLIAVTELRSNTMRMGVHREALAPALGGADSVFVMHPVDPGWDVAGALAPLPRARLFDDASALARAIANDARAGDVVLVMSNGDFDGVHGRILAALSAPAGGPGER
jgi:UDP-N-acetylmuramate: L-alanyl-gamma-D-glutamyl-meso-diaminopimelate ligase